MIKYALHTLAGRRMTVSEATRERVVINYILNVPPAQIAREEGISESTVDNIIEDFCREVGSTLGGKKKVKLLLASMRKSSLPLKHHTLAVKLLHVIVRYVNVSKGHVGSVADINKAVDFFADWCNICDSELLDPVKVANMAKEIKVQSDKLKVKPEDLPGEVERLVTLIEELRSEVEAVQAQKERALLEAAAARAERESELRKNDIILPHIQPFILARKKAASSGYKLEDYVDRILPFLKDIESGGVSIQYAISKLKQWRDMENEHEQWKLKCMEQFELNRQLEQLDRARLTSLAAERQFAERLHDLGINDDKTDRFVAFAKAYAKERNMPVPLAFEEALRGLEVSLQAIMEAKRKSADKVAPDPPTTAEMPKVPIVSASASNLPKAHAGEDTGVKDPPYCEIKPATVSGTLTVHSGTVAVSSAMEIKYSGHLSSTTGQDLMGSGTAMPSTKVDDVVAPEDPYDAKVVTVGGSGVTTSISGSTTSGSGYFSSLM